MNNPEESSIVEKDGEVLPAYTGSNAPYQKEINPKQNLADLKAMHPEFLPDDPIVDPSRLAELIKDTKSALPQRRSTPSNDNGITKEYLENRKKTLG